MAKVKSSLKDSSSPINKFYSVLSAKDLDVKIIMLIYFVSNFIVVNNNKITDKFMIY